MEARIMPLLQRSEEKKMNQQTTSQQPVNIQKIMEEIRAEIKEKGYTADMLSFPRYRFLLPQVRLTQQMKKLLHRRLAECAGCPLLPGGAR